MAVWGTEVEIADHTIEQHIYMLRRKLGLSPERGVWIRAAYGRGYRLEVRAAAARAPIEQAEYGKAFGLLQAVESAWQLGAAGRA